MTVKLTSPALGKQVGDSHTGPEEAWLVSEGYATKATTIPDAWTADANGVPGAAAPSAPVTATAATLAGGSNAATIATGGNLVVAVDHKTYTIALATSDNAAAAATKIDTALAGAADAAIVSSKLNVVTTGTGPEAVITVISGTGTVLANLGLAAGQTAYGTDGRDIGTSNTGPTATPPAKDLTSAANREPAPKVDPETGIQDSGPLDPAMTFTTADDDPNDLDVDYDFDQGGTNDDVPNLTSISPNTSVLAGLINVTITGRNFRGSTGGTIGGTPLTDFVVVDDSKITAKLPAKSAGSYPLVVTNATGASAALANAVTYAA